MNRFGDTKNYQNLFYLPKETDRREFSPLIKKNTVSLKMSLILQISLQFAISFEVCATGCITISFRENQNHNTNKSNNITP